MNCIYCKSPIPADDGPHCVLCAQDMEMGHVFPAPANALEQPQPEPKTIKFPDGLPPLLSAQAVRSKLVDVCRTLLYQAANEGLIDTVRIGRKRLFVTDSVIEWVNSCYAKTQRPNVCFVKRGSSR